MTKRDISGGLRDVATRRRLVEERIERTAAAEQSHEEAVKSHWDWYRRRIAQAQEKATGKPNAVAGLERLAANIAKRPLARRETLFLMVIENRLSKGEDIIEQEPRQRPFIPSTRPEWMYGTALLPKKPPSAKT